ncbi:hypothetical protein ACQZ4O_16145 [Agrobacterium vitis]
MATHAHIMERCADEVRSVSNITPIMMLFCEWELSLSREDGADAATVFEEENRRAELVQQMRREAVTCAADMAALILAETSYGAYPLDPRGSALIAYDLLH